MKVGRMIVGCEQKDERLRGRAPVLTYGKCMYGKHRTCLMWSSKQSNKRQIFFITGRASQ